MRHQRPARRTGIREGIERSIGHGGPHRRPTVRDLSSIIFDISRSKMHITYRANPPAPYLALFSGPRRDGVERAFPLDHHSPNAAPHVRLPVRGRTTPRSYL